MQIVKKKTNKKNPKNETVINAPTRVDLFLKREKVKCNYQ